MRVNERAIWEDDREVKLCRAQQSCSKRGESGWVLDRGIIPTITGVQTMLLNNKWASISRILGCSSTYCRCNFLFTTLAVQN